MTEYNWEGLRALVWDLAECGIHYYAANQVREQVWRQVGEVLWEQVRAYVRDEIWDNLAHDLYDNRQGVEEEKRGPYKEPLNENPTLII